jgi:hypothetical protein
MKQLEPAGRDAQRSLDSGVSFHLSREDRRSASQRERAHREDEKSNYDLDQGVPVGTRLRPHSATLTSPQGCGVIATRRP